MNAIYHWIGFAVFWGFIVVACLLAVGSLWMTFGPLKDNWRNVK